MKKFMFLIAALFIFSAAIAQERSVPTPTGTPIEVIQDDATLPHLSVATIENDAPSRAPGDAIFSENFNGTTFPPTGWTRTTNGSTTVQWARNTAQVHSADGSAFHNYSSTAALDGWLITPAIAVTGGGFELSFWSYIVDGSWAPANGSTILVSTTNTQTSSFTTIKTLSYADGEMGAAWQKISIPLAAYAGQTIYIAFRYQGTDAHAWYFDDVAINEPFNNDLTISAVYPFSQVPVTQTILPTLSAMVVNNGNLAQSNVMLTVLHNGTPIGTSDPITSLASGSSATLSVTTSNVAIITGENSLTYTISQTGGDEYPADNTVTRTFTGTPTTFATDNGTYTTYYGATTSNATYGNVYTFTKTTKLQQVMAYFYYNASSAPATTFNFAIYAMTGATTINTTALYTQNGIAKTAATAWVNINLTTPQELPAGSYYIAVTEAVTAQNFGLLGDSNGEGRIGYQRSGTTANLLATSGALFIRLTVDAKINDLQCLANGFPYTQIPSSQAAALPFPSVSAKAYNAGTAAQNNVTLTATYNGNTLGSSTPLTTIASFTTSADMTVAPPAGTVFPTTLGTNNVVYTVSQTQTDENPADNAQTQSFEITNNIFAVDGVTPLTVAGVGGGAVGARIGNYFTIAQTTTLTQVIVAFSAAAADLDYNIMLFTRSGNTVPATPIMTHQAVRPAGGGWFTVTVPTTIMAPGDYFLCVQEIAGVNIGILYDGVPGRPCAYASTGTGTTLTPQPNFGSVALRMVIAPPVYVTITTNVSPAGSGTVTGGGQCIQGTTVTLTAMANLGYMFQQWSDGITANPRTITVAGSATYTAVFETFPMDACVDQIVGNGTNTSYYLPVDNYNRYGYTQQIYTANELGFPFEGDLLITSIAFQFSGTMNWTNQTIYIGHTTKSTFDSNSDYIPISQMQQVYAGTIAYSGTYTWNTIILQTPFVYTGGNVVIAYLNNHGDYTGYPTNLFRVHAETNKAIYYGNDTQGNPINPATLTAAGARPTTRNNIQFHACGLLPNAKDMQAMSITGNTAPMALYSSDYVVTARNIGSLPASNFKVSIVTDGGVELASQTVTTTLTPGTTYTATLPVTVPQALAGALTIKGVVTLTGDENPANNEVSLALNVIPHPGYELNCNDEATITTGTTANNFSLPTNNYYNRSYTQQIYDAAEIGFTSGTIINGIAFLPTHITSGASNTYTKPDQSIYLANTTKSTFTNATDHIPAAQLQLVYSGPVTFYHSNASPVWNTINFDIPFIYTGGNIAVVVANNAGSYSYAGQVSTFRTGTATGKAIAIYTDNVTTITPSNIPTSTTATYAYRNHAKFIACEKLYTLNPLNIGNPMIELIPDPVPHGQTAVVNFSAGDDCHYITDVKKDGLSIGNVTSYNFGGAPITDLLPYFEIITEAYQYTITSSVNPAGNYGTITPLGTNTYDCGTNVIYTMTPNSGYKVGEILVDGVAVPNPMNKYTFTNLHGNHTIEVTFVECPFTIYFIQEGNCTIYQQFTNGDSNEITGGSIGVDYGMSHFTFVPDANYTLSAVYIDNIYHLGATTSGSYIFTNVTSDHTIKVIFKKVEFVIHASADAHGIITPSGNVSVPYAEDKVFTFTPNTGYEIDQVLVDNVVNSAAANAGSYTFENVTGPHTIFVSFKKTTMHVTASASGCGEVYPNGTIGIPYNGTQIFTFIPNEGCKVLMVYVDGVPYPNAIPTGSYTFYYVDDQPHTLEVVFDKKTYPITATITEHGMINNLGTTYVEHGDDQTYNFSALNGYKITNVMVDGINNMLAIQEGTYTFPNVTGPHTISVIIAPQVYTIKAETGTGGYITPAGNIPVQYQGSKAFTFAALPGYEIEKVLIDNVVNIAAAVNGAYAFTNVNDDHEIYVSFNVSKYHIMASVQGQGGAIAPMGITELTYFDNITYTITPDQDYKIDYVLVNGENKGALETFTFSDVLANADIEAHFLYSPDGDDDEDGEEGIINHTIDGLSVYSRTNVVYIVNENNLPISDVSIFDMYGRIVWQGKPQGPSITLNVANGIYNVRITSEDNFMVTKVPIVR